MSPPGRVTAADLRCYVVNLPRRPDRRDQIEAQLPRELRVTFTSDWGEWFDGRTLTVTAITDAGYRMFPWRIDSDNPWWNRPLKLGEIGCTLAHLACWNAAAADGAEYTIILEDDAILVPTFLEDLLGALARLGRPPSFDLLYLGRDPLEPDQPAGPGLVIPGYSHCTFGYLLTRRGIELLLDAGLGESIVPVDEFLPALYRDHPRADLRARFPARLRALAFDPPLVSQRRKEDAGSDTEDSAFVYPTFIDPPIREPKAWSARGRP